MKINNLKKSLNSAYRKVKPKRDDIEKFKKNLISTLDNIRKESEEYHKKIISDFLESTYYKPNHYINTKDRIDLVIHNGDNNSPVGVIIETKVPNSNEMVTKDNLSNKSMSQLILYYLRERFHKEKPNIEIKHLIITDLNEWFIFDAKVFEVHFAEKTKLVNLFYDFERKALPKTNTSFFYDEIAKPFIEEASKNLEFTYFNLQHYIEELRNDNKKDDELLVDLFKILSPEHLLKLPFANDSNSLDKRFYSELLHIIGLAETKDGSKKLIGRKKEGERNTGSILEDTIIQLDSLNKLKNLKNPQQYGKDYEEQLFNIALELSITWINRVLFLKLLEAQLISFNRSKEYAFLNINKIKNYDDLNSLFFQVLAIKSDKRNEDVKKLFANVPYLNSSLFESTELESSMLHISNLKDNKTIPILSTTVLKDYDEKRTGSENTLKYLFQFLDAYDFSSEGSGEIQEENKTLINASVLGLIFEKINGYKDGSFFTPGFITMYMCRETIRRAVVQKFNEVRGWNCKDLTDIYNKEIDITEANNIVNSLKICDPAVGSGHFLVSALNEIIAIKDELKILCDCDGKRLKEYRVFVENDELIIENEDGDLFEYKSSSKESLRIQKALFHEKQTIIENCLFGVDINPNSVKICRLRLWIELLKNAYYKNDTELETLPNIDINIKCGNSLVSRFKIDEDLTPHLAKKGIKIPMYRLWVEKYRNATSKEEKWQMESLIAKVKEDITVEISSNHPKRKLLSKVEGEITILTSQEDLFQKSQKDIDEWNKKLEAFTKESIALKKEIEELENNPIFQNSFEWRFEFPEVLNDNGEFIGFDVVIGNPPYGLYNKKQNQKISLIIDDLNLEFLKTRFPIALGGVINASKIFVALGLNISSKFGFQCMIIPFGILTDTSSAKLRKHLLLNNTLLIVEAFPERDNAKNRVFEDVKMSTSIILSTKRKYESDFEMGVSYAKNISQNRTKYNVKDLVKLSPELVQIPLANSNTYNLIKKIYLSQDVVKFGYKSKCLTGEIDMTFCKSILTNDINDPMLVKGVQIDRFVLKTKMEQISQGVIEFVDISQISNFVSNKKINDISQKRIVLQGLTGINESRRLKGTIVNANSFIANSCNYILGSKNLRIELILAWLNSKLLNFIFKSKSTSSNVNGYEVDELPFIHSNYDDRLIELVTIVLLKKNKEINTETTEYELEIDKIIYSIFNLTPEEIAIVEGKD